VEEFKVSDDGRGGERANRKTFSARGMIRSRYETARDMIRAYVVSSTISGLLTSYTPQLHSSDGATRMHCR